VAVCACLRVLVCVFVLSMRHICHLCWCVQGVVVAGGGERNSWQVTGPDSWISKLLRAEEDLWCGALSALHELYIQVKSPIALGFRV